MLKFGKLFKNTITYRLFFIYVLVILLPLFLYSLFSYRLSATTVESDYIKYMENLTMEIIRNMDDNVLILQKQSAALFLINEDINYILSTDKLNDIDKYFEVKARLDKYFLALLQMSAKLNGITLIDSKGEVKYAINLQGKNSLLVSVNNESWFKSTLALNGAPYFWEPHTNDYIFNETETKVISVSQSIFDYHANQPIGVLLVDQNADHFFTAVAKVNLQEDEQIIIISKTGNMIYSNLPLDEPTKQAVSDLYKSQKNANANLNIAGKKVLSITSLPSSYGFRVISLLPAAELQKKSAFLKNISILMLFIVTLFVLIISILVSYLIVKPLRKLMFSFKKLENGNFTIRVPVRGTHEFAQISKAFNHMVESIESLIKEKYEVNLLRKQAEFNALQSQINPHFLYNTLYSTKMVIDNHDNITASNMIQNLSELFRYSLSPGHHVTRLREEIDHVQKYFFLLEARFSGRYTIYYDIEEDLWNCDILRFTLQPLVENAIQHGLKETTSGGEIRISAKLHGAEWVIYVYDNGSGIPEDQLRILNANLERPDEASVSPNGHIGISNVNSRIKLHFGSQFGIKISSQLNSFTTIKVLLPFWTEKELKEIP